MSPTRPPSSDEFLDDLPSINIDELENESPPLSPIIMTKNTTASPLKPAIPMTIIRHVSSDSATSVGDPQNDDRAFQTWQASCEIIDEDDDGESQALTVVVSQT